MVSHSTSLGQFVHLENEENFLFCPRVVKMEGNGRWERKDVGKIQGDRGVILGFRVRELFGGYVCKDVPWLETPVAWLQDTRVSKDDIGQAEEETCVI